LVRKIRQRSKELSPPLLRARMILESLRKNLKVLGKAKLKLLHPRSQMDREK
jgi:hypothetical protein